VLRLNGLDGDGKGTLLKY